MSFLSPFFLFFLPLVSLPLIIHLLNRKKAGKIYFPALDFLIQATRRRLKRFRLLEYLLLILRTAVILLLTLAFARPVWRGTYAGGETDSHLILIDNSYSMGYRLARGDSLTLAKELAEAAVRNIEGSVSVAVVNSSLQEYYPFTGSREDMIENIRSIQLSNYPMDWPESLSDIVERALRGDSDMPNLIIISDFIKSGFDRGALNLSEDTGVLLVDVNNSSDNIWIESIGALGGYAGVETRIQAALRPDSAVIGGSLFIDGELRGNASDLSGDFSFRYTFSIPGEYTGRVILEEDLRDNRIEADSKRFFSIRIRPRRRVLLVDGRAGYTLLEGESYFISRALSPGTHRTPFIPETVTPSEIERMDLSDYSAVFLLDVETTPQIRSRLSEYVSRGGGVGIFAGENTLREQRFISSLIPVGFEPSDTLRSRTEGDLSADADMADIFSESEKINFRGIIGTRPTGELEPSLKVSGLPLLWVYSPRGRSGRVSFFTSSAGLRWNDFAMQPPYAPFINHLAQSLSSEEEDEILNKGIIGETSAEGADTPGIIESASGLRAVNIDASSGESALIQVSSDELSAYFAPASVDYIPPSDNLERDLIHYLTGEERSPYFLMAGFLLLAAEEFIRKKISFGEKI